MIFSHGDAGLPTKELTSLNLRKFQTCVSTFKFCPSFASAQLARALWGFLSRPTCLPPVLSGGSIINSSSPNKSWSRIQVNRCRAAPLPLSCLAYSARELLRAAQQRLGRQSVPAWTPLARSVSQPTWAFKVCLLQSQHGHPGNSSRSQDQWRHGRSRGRCRTSARRPTPARRYYAMPV